MLTDARFRELMAACDPNSPLEPKDRRNVDIDARNGRGEGLAWASKMAKRILRSDQPVKILATALNGSGKSTELLRLKKMVEDEGQLLVVLADAALYIDLMSPVDVPDILLSLIHAVDSAILEREGKDPKSALRDGYFRRFWDTLSRTDVAFNQVELNVADVATIPFELKTRPTLRARARAAVTGNLNHFLTDVRQEFVLFEERAKAAGFAGLCVIFDSLEKLRGISTNWEEVLRSAEQVFAGDAPYLSLPVHVVYTFPAALYTRIGAQVEFMPMVKLCERDDSKYEPGMNALRQVVRQRVSDKDLLAILGSEFKTRRDRLIAFSGGYIRQLIVLLRELLVFNTYPLTDRDLDHLLGEFRGRQRLLVTQDDYPWLARIAVTHDLSMPSEDARPTVERALQNLLVMCYANENPWYQLHPALRDYAPIVEAAKTYKARESKGI